MNSPVPPVNPVQSSPCVDRKQQEALPRPEPRKPVEPAPEIKSNKLTAEQAQTLLNTELMTSLPEYGDDVLKQMKEALQKVVGGNTEDALHVTIGVGISRVGEMLKTTRANSYPDQKLQDFMNAVPEHVKHVNMGRS